MQQPSNPAHPIIRTPKPRRREARTVPSVVARVVSVPAAAEELNVSTRTIWRLLDRRQLQSVRCGRAVRVVRESIDQFIKTGGSR